MSLLSKIISLGIILSSISPQLKSLRFNKELSIDAKEPSDEALLKEYEVCQQDINSTSSNYWTLAGIFIGVSSVLLAGIIYGVLANDNGFNAIDCTLRTLVTIFGVAIITILVFLWFWLKRVNYLTDRNYERMREIELDLGMWKSWRVHSIDTWKDLGFKSSDTLDDKKIDEIWNSMKGKLKERLPEKYFKRLRERKKELVQFCNRCNRFHPQHWYEGRSRNLHYIVILSILIGLWLSLILSVWLPLIAVIIAFPVSTLIVIFTLKKV